MEEIYRIIEEKIKASGYTGAVSGREVYNDICDQIDEQENGMYVLMSKWTDDLVFEYTLSIGEEDFNLARITIIAPEGQFTAEFDP